MTSDFSLTRRPGVRASVLREKRLRLKQLVKRSLAQTSRSLQIHEKLANKPVWANQAQGKKLLKIRRNASKISDGVDSLMTRVLSADRSVDSDNYADQDYWETRYTKQEEVERSFEWFMRYEDVDPLLREVLDYDDRTAMFIDLGCGLSMFLRDLKQSGYRGPCLGLDFSANAIETMKARADCKDIDFLVCDATQLPHKVKMASVILDKSLMDTMLHSQDESMAAAMLRAVAKSIKPDGVFISITQLDPRKPDDSSFLQSVVLPNLLTGTHGIESVTAHITSPSRTSHGDSTQQVPSVIFYKFRPNKTAMADLEVDIKEYESSEDGN